jgi:hypothetical protein
MTKPSNSSPADAAYVLFTQDDLVAVSRGLGPKHPVAAKIRAAFDDLDSPALTHYRDAAVMHRRDGDIEIDDNAIVSKGDDAGAYVMAWIWIDDSELATPAKRRRS